MAEADYLETNTRVREAAAVRRRSRLGVMAASPTKMMENIPPVQRPALVSPNPLKGKIKATVYKMINWQVQPVAHSVDLLQDTTTVAISELEERLVQLEEAINDRDGMG